MGALEVAHVNIPVGLLIWVMIILTVSFAVIQEMCARLGSDIV